MTDDQEIKIRLEAEDDASVDVDRVTAAFEKLRAKYEEVVDEMFAQGNIAVSMEAFEKQVLRAGAALSGQFAQAGLAAESRVAGLINRVNQLEAASQRAAESAATRQAARQQDILERQAYAGIDAQSKADAQRLENAAKVAQQERRSREETFFLTQQFNQESIRLAEQRARAEIQAAEKVAAAEKQLLDQRRQAVAGFTSAIGMQTGPITQALSALGGAGGTGGLLGGIGSIAGGLARVTGPVGIGMGVAGGALGGLGSLISGLGNVAWGTITGGINAIGSAVQGVTGLFGNMLGSIMGAADGITHFIAIGVGIYTVYEVVNLVERAFRNMFSTITEFQDKMIQVQSLTLHGAQDFDMMKESILSLSMETGRPARELGDALFFIESHGYKGAEAINILTYASKQAASGLGETNDLIRIVTGQMIAYGASAAEAGHYFDVFAQTERLASLRIGDLSDQLQRITPVTAALGIPIEQVGAAIATISQTGLPAGRTITDLGAALQSLIKLTPQAKETLDAMGLSADELRKSLTEKGLFAALTTIWERSGHDVEAVSRVFGDGARALVGYLALMEQNGKRYKENLDLMYEAAGATEQVWRKNQERLSVQMQRSQSIFQAYGIALSETMTVAVAGWLEKVNDAFASGDITKGVDLLVDGLSNAAASILNAVTDLGSKMFGAGVNIVSELARGMFEAIDSVLTAAANAVASLIAAFLLGGSPPPRGPLHYMEQGTRAWMQAQADAMNANTSLVVGAASNVATAVNDQLAKIGQVGSRESIEKQIAAINQQLLPWQIATEQIKGHYEALLTPLERQLEILKNIKDVEYERKQLKFEERDIELGMLKLRAEGDPVKRAQLAGQIARQQITSERHGIDRQIATAQRRLSELGRSKMSPRERALEAQSIRDELAMLNLRKQQAGLTDPALMAQYTTKKAMLEYDKEAASLEHRSFELARDKAMLPIQEQHDKIKAAMQAELDYIHQQTDALEDQKKMLQAILNLLPKPAAGGAGGAAGAGWKMDPTTIQHIVDNIKIDLIVQKLRDKIETGINTFVNSPTYRTIGESLGGALIGYMIGGFPGAMVGLSFGPKLAEAFREYGITMPDMEKLAGKFWQTLRTAFVKARVPLEAGDFLGTVDSLKESFDGWMADLSDKMFKVWWVDPIATMTEHGVTETTVGPRVRRTGPGRAFIEALFGLQDTELNAARAWEMIKAGYIDPIFKMISNFWNEPVTGVVTGEGPQGYITKTMSRPERIANDLLTMLDRAFMILTAKLGGEGGPAEKLGEALGVAFTNAIKYLTTNDKAKTTIGQGLFDLGLQVGGRFMEGIIKGLTGFTPQEIAAATDPLGVRTGVVNAIAGSGVNITDPLGARRGAAEAAKGFDITDPLGIRTSIAKGLGLGGGGDEGKGTDAGAWFEMGKNAITGFLNGQKETLQGSELQDENYWYGWFVKVPKEDVLDDHSPSGTFRKMGENVILGFNEGINNNAATTGPVVRAWLTNNVIDQARAILIGGGRGIEEGSSVGAGGGGLKGVANQAVSDMDTVFATMPGYMVVHLNSFGTRIVTEIMRPIKGSDGLVKQMQDVVDAAARVKPGAGVPNVRLTPPDQPTGVDPNADPRVTALALDVPTANARGDINVNVAVNGGDPNEVQRAVASGIDQALADNEEAMPGQFLSAWRTAKAQGYEGGRPIGVQKAGARG